MSGEFDDAITRLEGEIAIRQEEIAVRQAALNALRALDGSGEVPPAPAHRPAPAPQRAAAVSHARHSDASQDDEMTRQVLLAVQTSRTPLSSPEIQRAAKLTSVTRPTITKILSALVRQKRVISDGFGRWTKYRPV